MAKKTEEKNDTALATQGTTAIAAYDFGDDAVELDESAKGTEYQSNADVSIPFIVFLQAGSPIVQEPANDGAQQPKAGDMRNSVTGDLYSNPKGLIFVAGTTRHKFAKFTPRDKGGGFQGNLETDDPIVLEAAKRCKFGEYVAEDGDELTETFYVFGATCSEEGEATGMAVLSFTSSKIKIYKNWMSLTRAHTVMIDGKKKRPPLWSHLIRITTEFKKFSEGSAWIPVIKPLLGSVEKSIIGQTDERFQLARAASGMMSSGVAKVDYEQTKSQTGGGGAGEVF